MNGNEEELKREKLLQQVKDDPLHSTLVLECAYIHDRLGYEKDAVNFYERAIKLGLTQEQEIKAFLCLGSTYRAIGEYIKAKEIIELGMIKYPEHQEYKVFYSLILYNLQDYQSAMELLIKSLCETTKDEGILHYKRALLFYSDKLNQTW